MAVKHYILSKCFSFSQDRSVHVDSRQMALGDSYEAIRPLDVIADSIFAGLEPILNSGYSVATVRSLLKTDGKYRLSLSDDEFCDDISSVILVVDNQKRTYYYDIIRSDDETASSRYMYRINSIDEQDVAYLVLEYIVDPSPDCTLVEHCYHECFDDLSEAQSYLDDMTDRYNAYVSGLSDVYTESPDSGYRLFVVSKSQVQASSWYKNNLAIAAVFDKYSLNCEDYRLMSDEAEIMNTVYADAYNDLSSEDQCRVDMMIYESLRKYIDADTLTMLDDDINNTNVDADTVMYIADQAIALALLQAESEEVFREVHAVLGPNDWRVGSLTDDIWNAHPGQGYIVITMDNRMQWYSECYSINEWEGAKGNPFFGVFQKNTPEPLLCFREYHPELIVNRLPTAKEMQHYEQLYQAACAERRQVHPEMRFSESSGHQPIVTGDWYKNGILSSQCEQGTAFYQKYLSHMFTIDECKKLLSGEEISIDHFVTKMGDETIIRGKLANCFGAPDGITAEFMRTDINPKQRRLMAAEYGIADAGIDDDDDWD